MPAPTNRTYWEIIRDNVFTFVNNVILILGVALVLVGKPMDALISVAVIGTNIVVSVVQEVRAKRVLDRIALLTRPTATVIRDGQVQTIGPDQLVLGDVLKVAPGDQILLDGKVIGEGRMQVDESLLTGESNLVPKGLGDPVYSGSFCVTGTGIYEAEKVGDSSLANQLTASAKAYRRVLTPLQHQINLMIRIILLMVVYLEIMLVASGVVNSLPLPDSITQATVVVGLVPNGLFVAIAVAYALGAVRIVRFGALVQQSNAIESLSHVDLLCLDKTGTLTTNRLAVADVYPCGGVSKEELQAMLGTMAASSSAHNKTSEAIAAAYAKQVRYTRPVAEVPFSSARKWSAVAFMHDGAGEQHGLDLPSGIVAGPALHGVYALGAPEMLRVYLGPVGADDSPVWQELMGTATGWMSLGLRVLLVTHSADPTTLVDQDDDSRLPDGMQPLGLVSLNDELRPEAKATLASFIENGVNPKIISGDNPETVAALAMQAGLGDGIKLVSGLELDEMDDDQFRRAAAGGTIFGRITPQQKERLVDVLRDSGYYVAMIGDGVNDVLSLKKANLGVAMQSGSQATRSVADIVLMNDSFAALAPAVAEGQRIVNGMQDVLKLFMARIATMTLVIVTASMVGLFPINIRHGTVLTLWTVGIPAILLAYWAQPSTRYKSTLALRLFHFVLPAAIVSSLLALIVFYAPILYRLVQITPPPSESSQAFRDLVITGQTSLTTFLVLTGLLLVVFVEPPSPWWVGGDVLSGDWRPAILAGFLAIGYVVMLALPATRSFFDLHQLNWKNVLLVLACTSIWLLLVRLMWRQRWLERFFGLET